MAKTTLKTTSKTKEKKYVYFFGGKKAEGKAEMKNLLGGKGANLAEMDGILTPCRMSYNSKCLSRSMAA